MADHIFQSILPIDKRRLSGIFLAFIWISGSLLGMISGLGAGESFRILMRFATNRQPGLLALLSVAICPLLFCGIFAAKPIVQYSACFWDAFLLSYMGCVITAAFGSAGWLVCGLLLFTDLLTAPVLFWFCRRNIISRQTSPWRDFSLCAVLLTFVGSFDYYFVSPFLAMLIEI